MPVAELMCAPMVRLFAGILRRERDDYFLVTPAEKLRIRVDDVPFLAVDMEVRHQGEDTDLLFTTEPELKWPLGMAKLGVDVSMLSSAAGHA